MAIGVGVGVGAAVGVAVAVGVGVGVGVGVTVAVGTGVAVAVGIGVGVAVGGMTSARARLANAVTPPGSISQMPPSPTTSPRSTAESKVAQRGNGRGRGMPPSAGGGSIGAL